MTSGACDQFPGASAGTTSWWARYLWSWPGAGGGMAATLDISSSACVVSLLCPAPFSPLDTDILNGTGLLPSLAEAACRGLTCDSRGLAIPLKEGLLCLLPHCQVGLLGHLKPPGLGE